MATKKVTKKPVKKAGKKPAMKATKKVVSKKTSIKKVSKIGGELVSVKVQQEPIAEFVEPVTTPVSEA